MSTREYRPEPALMHVLRGVVGVSGILFLIGLFAAPQRVWGGYLMGFHFLAALALSGVVFLAFLYLARASWAAALQRILEAMARAIPVAGLIGLGLLLGLPSLYEWAHPAAVEHDALLHHKSGYLNTVGFSVRMILMFALWIWLSRKILMRSRLGAEGASDWPHAAGTLKWSAAFIAVFAITYSIASFDWLMSLEPHWFSTVFTLYQLAGLGVAGAAAAILLTLWLERRGALQGIVRDDHVHDMAKLLFSCSLFWGYIWYCQYMLIWYADIPEETAYYLRRKEGHWWLLVQSALVLKWFIPFVALMARRACRSRVLVSRVAGVVLLGHAIDLYTHVGPTLSGGSVRIGLWEIAPVIGAVALFFLVTLRALGKAPIVVSGDPRLAESMSYHTS